MKKGIARHTALANSNFVTNIFTRLFCIDPIAEVFEQYRFLQKLERQKASLVYAFNPFRGRIASNVLRGKSYFIAIALPFGLFYLRKRL